MNKHESEQAETEQLIEAQLKHCSNILTRLRRNANAGPFLKPVDPVALGIPDYFDKISHPMDISTVKKKLDNKEYRSPEEFNGDMVLMFNNCYSYNTPDSAVYVMGKDLQKSYEGMYGEMPQEVVKKPKVESPGSRVSEKPRRAAKLNDAMSAEDYEFCADVLSDLEKPKHKRYSWPFMYPVSDDEAPGYSDIVKSPMDLSTIRGKLDARKYSTAQDFIADLNLIISNCFLYNRPDTEIYKFGEEMDRAIQGLINKQKEPDARINELRKKIAALSAELKQLEKQKGETRQVYTLADRERVGKAILSMTRAQTEKVAEIVQRYCAYEYVDNDEVEVNLQVVPDEVIGEIDSYIQKIKNNEADDGSNSSEE